MSSVFRCLFGPSLFRYNIKPGGHPVDYQALAGERWGDTILTSLSTTARLLLYVSPIVIPWAINRGWASQEGVQSMSKFLVGVGVVVAGAIVIRTLGRLSNPVYNNFMSVLATAQRNFTPTNKQKMAGFDFQFSSWPVDFNVTQETGYVFSGSSFSIVCSIFSFDSLFFSDTSKPDSYMAGSKSGTRIESPYDILAWLMVRSFGISLVYPGSMALMRMMLERPLLEGRTKLVVENGGDRAKVVTGDGNEIDTMFVDMRNRFVTAAI